MVAKKAEFLVYSSRGALTGSASVQQNGYRRNSDHEYLLIFQEHAHSLGAPQYLNKKRVTYNGNISIPTLSRARTTATGR